MKGTVCLLLLCLVLTHAAQDTCKKQSDCRALSECKNSLCIHKELTMPAPSEYIGMVVIFILSGLGAASGLGGGPLMTPTFILIWFFSSYDAIPLSQLVIFCSCLMTIYVRMQQRHPEANRPMIDWDLLVLLEPPIITGTLFGVLLNYVLPDWSILIMLELLLIFCTYSAGKKTLEDHRKEVKRRQNEIAPENNEAQELQAKAQRVHEDPKEEDSDLPASPRSESEQNPQADNHEEDPNFPDVDLVAVSKSKIPQAAKKLKGASQRRCLGDTRQLWSRCTSSL